MSDKREIKVPDIGDLGWVHVTEILVSEGDQIEVGQAVLTLQGRTAMDVQSLVAGKLVELTVMEGHETEYGDVIAIVEVSGNESGNDEGNDRKKEKGKREK